MITERTWCPCGAPTRTLAHKDELAMAKSREDPARVFLCGACEASQAREAEGAAEAKPAREGGWACEVRYRHRPGVVTNLGMGHEEPLLAEVEGIAWVERVYELWGHLDWVR